MDYPWWSSDLLWSDPLHVIFLGIGRDFVASLLKLFLLADVFVGKNWEDKNNVAFQQFREFCKSNKKASPSIETMDIKQPLGYPTIVGAKAMDIKFMIAWLASIAEKYVAEHCLLVQTTIFCLMKFVAVMDHAGFFVSDSEAVDLIEVRLYDKTFWA